jgi:hypothetical protein
MAFDEQLPSPPPEDSNPDRLAAINVTKINRAEVNGHAVYVASAAGTPRTN